MNNLRYVIPDIIDKHLLSEEERIEFLNMQIENKVEYLSEYGGLCSIYGRTIKNKDGIVIFMKYWGLYKGNIYLLGSGGYIPEFHLQDKRIYEFFLKTYDISKLNEMLKEVD